MDASDSHSHVYGNGLFYHTFCSDAASALGNLQHRERAPDGQPETAGPVHPPVQDIYRLSPQDALSETKLVYDKESDAVVLLDYQDEDIPMGRISRDALFINVDSGSSEGHPAAHGTL